MLQIVTDSSCDLPEELIRNYNIRIVPLMVNIDDKNYREGIDITPQEFYERMAQCEKLPKTSQPAPGAFAEVFQNLSRFGQVFCLTISSKLSGTYRSACIGRDMSEVDAVVFDTLAGSLGHGLQVLRASELALAGYNAKEVEAELDKYRRRMKILILLNTLENIVKGGRLSRIQGTIAKILNIRILLHNVEGAVVLLEKVHGKKKFMDRVLQTIIDYSPDLKDQYIGITHFNNLTDAEFLAGKLREIYKPRDILINYMGSTMATYAGEGGIIISW